MSRSFVVLVFLLFSAPAIAASTAAPNDVKYLHYGDALYYAYQDDWVEAIVRLDAQLARSRGLGGPAFEAIYSEATLAVGCFELNYRMHQHAGRAMKTVIEGAAQDPLRNEALFRLARMYFQKDQPENALQAVQRIRGEVPEAIRSDLAFLRANIAMAVGRNAEAVAVLKELQGEKSLEGFNSYNLGIALMRNGVSRRPGVPDRTGRITALTGPCWRSGQGEPVLGES
jgi:tetratricopeptide (TPR) repeat protein